MGIVSTGFSMSLDGFVAGPNDDETQVFVWMTSGDTDFTLTAGTGEYELKISEESAEMFEEAINTVGVLVAGRRLFDMTGAWGGKHPMNVPVVVVTHNIPQEWVYEGSTFTFVTDGVESSIKKAQEIAGDKKIAIASTTIVQQALNAGLLDEIHIDLVPFLLGDGVRLFERLKVAPVELGDPQVGIGKGVTHLTYPVKKKTSSKPAQP